MENIQFPYRGWIVKVTPEADGWTAHLHHPRMKSDRFFAVARQFFFAVDAVQAAMRWADLGALDSALREVLRDEKESRRLSLKEFNSLSSSCSEFWRSQRSAIQRGGEHDKG